MIIELDLLVDATVFYQSQIVEYTIGGSPTVVMTGTVMDVIS